MGFFPGTQKRVRNTRGNRAISVGATEVPLYICTFCIFNGSRPKLYFCRLSRSTAAGARMVTDWCGRQYSKKLILHPR